MDDRLKGSYQLVGHKQYTLCATGRGQLAQSRAAPTRRSQGGTPTKMLATPAALVNEGRRR